MSNPGTAPPQDRAPADLVGLLSGLAETIKERLAPIADSAFLRAELYSLSSILRILSSELPELPDRLAADRHDLRALIAGSAPGQKVGDGTLRLAAARLAASDDPATRRAVRDYVTRDLSRGISGLMSIDEHKDRSSAPAHFGGDRARPASEDLRARLAEFTKSRGFGTLTDMTRSSEGYGAETVVCSVSADAADARLVVRIQWTDLPIARLIQPVAAQAQAMTAAAAAGVRTPRVRLVSPCDEIVGAPLLVTDFVPGYVPTTWTTEGRSFIDRLAETRASDWLADLVRIHAAETLGILVAPLRLGASNVEHQQTRVRQLEEVYRASELQPDPLIEEVLAFLKDGVAEWGEAVLIHGDYRPGNIIYSGDLSAAAVLDWDCAHVNDFHEDLGHVVAWPWRGAGGLECGLLPRPLLLAEYAKASGRTVHQSGVTYYEVQSAFRRYLGFAGLARAWLDRGGDIRMARAWMALARDRVELGRLLGYLAPRQWRFPASRDERT